MSKIAAISLVFVFLASYSALAQAPATNPNKPQTAKQGEEAPDAPFGLTWAATKADVEKLGVALKSLDSKDGQRYSASGLPKILADAEAVVLNFGFQDKLLRIVAISKAFENDRYGGAVRERYDEIARLLGEKYGKGKSVHHTGSSIYKDPEYWVSGIRSGDNQHFTNFKSGGLSIQINIRADSSNDAKWILIYENDRLMKEFEQDKAKKEKGAL